MNNQPIFTLNKELASKAGGGDFISETGYYVGSIDKAQYVVAATGTMGLELSVTTDGGKANYLTLYYSKSDKSIIAGGSNMIQAIMAVTGCNTLSATQVNGAQGVEHVAPELQGKHLGLVLQKVLYTKNDGSDGYKFQIVTVSNQQKQTAKEMIEQNQAAKIDLMLETLKDKDERQAGKASNQSQSYGDTGYGQQF